MFKDYSKYGNIHIGGVSVNIDKTNIAELDKYLEKLEREREQIIQQQNDYLSQMIG